MQDLATDRLATMRSLVERVRQYTRDVRQLMAGFTEEVNSEVTSFEASLQSVAHTTFLSGMDTLLEGREDWHRAKVRLAVAVYKIGRCLRTPQGRG
jgi:hypothetical protein